jgi:hypothetical protein
MLGTCMTVATIDSQSVHVYAVVEGYRLSDVQVLAAREWRADPYHGEQWCHNERSDPYSQNDTRRSRGP